MEEVILEMLIRIVKMIRKHGVVGNLLVNQSIGLLDVVEPGMVVENWKTISHHAMVGGDLVVVVLL